MDDREAADDLLAFGVRAVGDRAASRDVLAFARKRRAPVLQLAFFAQLGEPRLPFAHDIEYQLSETLRKVIYHVLRYGEALFEIVPEIHEEEVFNFGFVEVYNFTVIRDGDDVYQLQPGRGEKSQLKKIPAERLFIFKLPDALDKKIRDVIRRLGDINNEAFYALTLERIKDRNANNIDIAARRFAEKTTIAMITREIGWNVRDRKSVV